MLNTPPNDWDPNTIAPAQVQTGSEMTVLPVTHQNYPGIFTTWNRVTSWDSGTPINRLPVLASS